MAIIAILITPLLTIITSLNDKQALIKTGLSVAAVGLLFLIAYSLADNEVTTLYAQFNIGPSMSKIIGGALIMSYLLFGILSITLIYTEVAKAFK